ncbi:protein of unknown function [Serratia sp. Tan611]|nr:protein of unknown function [Serratia sp. Tan611]
MLIHRQARVTVSLGTCVCAIRWLTAFCQRGAKAGIHHFNDGFEELSFDFRFSQLLLKFFNTLFGRQGEFGHVISARFGRRRDPPVNLHSQFMTV